MGLNLISWLYLAEGHISDALAICERIEATPVQNYLTMRPEIFGELMPQIPSCSEIKSTIEHGKGK
jgi:hypothetical protein